MRISAMDFLHKLGALLICSLGLLSLTNGQQVEIIPKEKVVKKFINDTYFVSCTLTDGSTNAFWINPKGQKIDSSPQSRIRVEISYGVDLFLNRITTQDEGLYSCVAPKGNRASFNLSVIRPIVFDTSLAEQAAPEGQTYAMKCRAQGQSQPRIIWKVDQRNPQSPKYKIMKDALLIHNVTQHDAYRHYMCRAMDMDSPIPDTKTMNITLKVKMRPRLMGNAKTEHWGVLGEWANLTCSVKAEPPARFEWLHRGRNLSPSDETFIINDENKSTLQVLVQHESKFGDYVCRARNELGSMNRTMTLFKGQKPPPPILEEELATPDAVKIRVKQGSSGIDRTKDPAQEEERKKGKLLPIIGFVVQYKMATRGDWTPANATKYDGGRGFILRGLTPQITYYIRAASKNVASVGDFSNPLKVITPKTSPWKITDTAANVHPTSVVAVLFNLVILQILLLLIDPEATKESRHQYKNSVVETNVKMI